MEGKFIDTKDKVCPHLHCGQPYVKILDRDKDIAQLECQMGHRWSVILRDGSIKSSK
jgi:hypothetical protein